MEGAQTNDIAIIATGITLMPLFSFLLLIFFGKKLEKKSGILATAVLAFSALLSLYVFYQVWLNQGSTLTHFEWFSHQTNAFVIGINIDKLAAIMLVVVTLVSGLVHLFSLVYMKGDKNFPRYFAYLGLFTFSMLGIILTNNIIFIYIFWELVGVSSYLLIGFWQEKPAALKASKKAFLVNRIGDAGFLVGILSLFALFQNTDLGIIASKHFSGVYAVDFASQYLLISLAGMGLFCGAIGKSAQFPLSVWLPDAMEGPTPVSALIHAATMVAAGVYMLARIAFIFTPEVQIVIAAIGTITAFMAAYAALSQNDIKAVLAFSTISQLGYMVMGIGVGTVGASLFHLVTHAFFKACLFLSAGAIIHVMHQVEHDTKAHFDPQDMRNMGGLRKKIPVVFIAYLFSAMALAGLPLFSGFLSKDAILVGAYSFASEYGGAAYLIPLFGFLSALFTAFYVGRQLIMVFFGEFNLEDKIKDAGNYIQDISWEMKLPLVILGFLSIGFVFSLNPFDGENGWLLATFKGNLVIDHSQKLLVEVISASLAISGLGLAWLVYGNRVLYNLKQSLFPKSSFAYKLSLNFWYMDSFYERVLVKNSILIAEKLKTFDLSIIDGIVNKLALFNVIFAHIIAWVDKYIVDGFVNFMVMVSGKTGNLTRSFQGGKVQSYFAWTLFGFICLLIYLINE
ncbi:NADH-quinone oxidoreductase subunit L [Flexithrix dorotheae]|uniref:NADH-quinone oxidoreductase subunit L n=1 Tax=Flexithrix dorotheae TaxID=70993 RepID=UPI00035E76F2|nr:NADH-quinone oxidoreductase subunit L [Flexithrix dorotheae]